MYKIIDNNKIEENRVIIYNISDKAMEEVGYSIIDREDEIENICRRISESNISSEKIKMLKDLKYLLNLEDKYVLSSLNTNEYVAENDGVKYYGGGTYFEHLIGQLIQKEKELFNSISSDKANYSLEDIEKFYLDYVNNYLIVEKFAYANNITIKKADMLISFGRLINRIQDKPNYNITFIADLIEIKALDLIITYVKHNCWVVQDKLGITKEVDGLKIRQLILKEIGFSDL